MHQERNHYEPYCLYEPVKPTWPSVFSILGASLNRHYAIPTLLLYASHLLQELPQQHKGQT